MVKARHGGDLPRGPGTPDHEEARLVGFHGQKLAGALVRHDGPQQMLRLLERSDIDEIVVRCGASEVDRQIVRRQNGQHVAIFQLHRPVVLEMHDHGAEELGPRSDSEVLCQVGDRAYAFQRDDLGAMGMATLADLVRNAADFERMGPRVGDVPAIAESYGFNSAELARILRVVAERRTLILKAWDDHFGDGGPF